MTFKLLIIDDDPLITSSLCTGFRSLSIDVFTAGTGAEGLKQVTRHQPDAILLDVGLPDQSGLQLFWEIVKIDSRIPTIIMTGHGTTETAIEAMKLGAFDYVTKPFTFPKIRDLTFGALEVSRQMRTPVRIDDGIHHASGAGETMVGRCEAMQDVFKMVGRVARQTGTVLIRGESGTGKELIARAIYQHGSRFHKPFMAVNCAAIPEALLESELFGYEKGAFTGADQRRIGKFEQCTGGTLFLDEIGDMSPLTQAKVLRLLQDQRFQRVGGNETIQTDARLIVATHRPLEKMVANGEFREDLYYRLNIFTIELPPLRERIEDLPYLVNCFLHQFSEEMGREVRGATAETNEILTRYPWPGNIRELQSILKQALLMAVGPMLLPEFLPPHIRREANRESLNETPDEIENSEWREFVDRRLQSNTENLYAEWFARTERQLLVRVLRHTEGNQLQAAKILGITRRSLRGKISAHEIAIQRSISSGKSKSG